MRRLIPININPATAIQLGAVAAISVATLASGGMLAPLVAGLACGDFLKNTVQGLVPNILSGLFSDTVKGHFSDADKEHRSKQNHDVQRAINTAIAQCLEEAAGKYAGAKDGTAFLQSIGKKLKTEPLSLQLTAGTEAIEETNVTAILSSDADTIRKSKPLTTEQWEELITQYAQEVQLQAIPEALSRGAAYLEEHFAAKLVQVLKEMGAESDPAWFAVVLRFLGEIHADVKEIKGDMAALKQAFADHADEMTKAINAMMSACEARSTSSTNPAAAARDKEEVAAIQSIMQQLGADIPKLQASLTRIETTLATISGKLDTIGTDAAGAHTEAKFVADALREGGYRIVAPTTNNSVTEHGKSILSLEDKRNSIFKRLSANLSISSIFLDVGFHALETPEAKIDHEILSKAYRPTLNPSIMSGPLHLSNLFSEAKARGNRCGIVLFGPAGCGKTTFLSLLREQIKANRTSNECNNINKILFVPSQLPHDTSTNASEYKAYIEELFKQFVNILSNGEQFLILVDDLQSVEESLVRSWLLEKISNVLNSHPTGLALR